MKAKLHIGWVLFALVMVWGECVGDVPRLLFPQRTTMVHFLMALVNAVAVLGLVLYAFRRNDTRNFWRLFAPVYAAVMAAELGYSATLLGHVLRSMARVGGDTPLVFIGAITIALPIAAMAIFTLIALLRLGDWIGPTRRPFGAVRQQLELPL